MRASPFTACLLLLAAATARSQTVEITPIVGYRLGGSLGLAAGTTDPMSREYHVDDSASFGVQVAVRVARDGEIELVYSRQDTRLVTHGLFTGRPIFDFALESWHGGGNYLFAEEDARVRPYIGMGLGITRLLPEPADLHDDTRFSASFAAGVKVWLGRHVGLRVEARGFFTFLEGERQTSCQTGEGCQVHAQGSEISQGEIRGGLALRF